MAIGTNLGGVVLKADKKTPPKGLQALTPKIAKTILDMNLQQKSRFDFILSRTPGDNETPFGIGTVGSILGLGTDLYVGKVFVQKITYSQNKLVTDKVNGDEYVKDIEYPTGVTINFLEDEFGSCMRYLQDWLNDIYFPASVASTKRGYIFRDNQEGARRTGLLLMANLRGKFPPTFPRVTFYGLFPKDLGQITIGQDEKDNLTYDVEFSVREIRTARVI